MGGTDRSAPGDGAGEHVGGAPPHHPPASPGQRQIFCLCFLTLIKIGVRKQNSQGEVWPFLFAGPLSRTVCNIQHGTNAQAFHLRSPGIKALTAFQYQPWCMFLPRACCIPLTRDTWGLQSHQHTSNGESPQNHRASREAEDSGPWRLLQD